MSEVCYHPARRKHPPLFQGVPIGFQLGIDLGGSKLAIAIADPDGRLIAHKTRPSRFSGDPEADVSAIAADAADLVSEAGLAASDFDAAGLSVPGPIDHERGAILDPPNLPGWQDVPLRARMSELLGLPVRLENDANAAALAEWRYGAGRGSNNLVFLTMSTGVGAGLILDGRLYRGTGRGAGEVGHARVCWDDDAELCGCGKRGCLEAYVGGAPWTRRLRERGSSPEEATPEHIVAAARRGDAFALEEMDRFNHYLARGIVNLGFTLAPQAVILGTIAVAAGETLCLAPVRELVARELWAVLAEDLVILPASLGDELPNRAGLGVALEALERISESPG